MSVVQWSVSSLQGKMRIDFITNRRTNTGTNIQPNSFTNTEPNTRLSTKTRKEVLLPRM